MAIWPLVIDALLVVLLAGVAVGLVLLHRRLAQLRAEQRQFAALVARLESAGERTRAALAAFKEEAAGLADLDERVRAAAALKDELRLITEAGEALANRLTALAESAARTRRTAESAAPAPSGTAGTDTHGNSGRVVVLESLKSLR